MRDKDKLDKIEINQPMRMWWAGDQRVEPYMHKVREAIERNIPGGCTDIYNRCYEAVYQAIVEHADKKKLAGEK